MLLIWNELGANRSFLAIPGELIRIADNCFDSPIAGHGRHGVVICTEFKLCEVLCGQSLRYRWLFAIEEQSLWLLIFTFFFYYALRRVYFTTLA